MLVIGASSFNLKYSIYIENRTLDKMSQAQAVTPKDVMIGFPCYDNRAEVDVFQECLNAVQDPHSVVRKIQFYNGDSLVSRARNKITDLFIEDKECKYLMFIDSDIRFNRGFINRLRSHDKGIVGGAYLKKKLPYAPVMNAQLGEEGELSIMREIGTGFMMIRKDVFEAIRVMYPEQSYHYDDDERGGAAKRGYDWWRVGVYEDRYLSEDYFFCQLAATLGYKTYLDKSILCQHIGKISYPMEDKQLLEGAVHLLENYRTDLPLDFDLVGRFEQAISYQRAHRNESEQAAPQDESIRQSDTNGS